MPLNLEVEYVECPFCDKLFPARAWASVGSRFPMEKHINEVHKKFKVWKGRNAKWVDMKEINRRLEKEGS